MNVLFRKDPNGFGVVAFMPDCPVNYGNIMAYEHVGQHGEASIGYYQVCKKAEPEEYADLLKELESIYAPEKLTVKKRLNYDELVKNWRT